MQMITYRWINNKVLLYNIGNYIQLINHNGKRKKEMCQGHERQKKPSHVLG